MNPIANTPVFVSLTTEDDDATKKSVARRSILLTFAIVAAMSITGNYIFSVFGLTMPALRITGGILLFIIGYHMMQGSGSKTHTPSDEDIRTSRESQLSVAVSPLAVPLLAGPGTIATAMSFASYGGLDYVLISLSMFGVICAATYLCFISSEEIIDFLGQGGLNVITRLMGLILATIGTGMFLDGVGAEIAIFVKQFA
jgi:multiple antibiotic resistance protein